jgi:hypothetical protein
VQRALDGGAEHDVGGGGVHRPFAERAARGDAPEDPAGGAHVDLRLQHQRRAAARGRGEPGERELPRGQVALGQDQIDAVGARLHPGLAAQVEERDLELPVDQLVDARSRRRRPAIEDVGAHQRRDRVGVGAWIAERRRQRRR